MTSVSFLGNHPEDLTHNLRFLRADGKITHDLPFLVLSALIHKHISVWQTAACIDPLRHHLVHTGLDTDGGLFGFARRLPETDVVHQLVHMLIKFLLPFIDAPNLNAVVGKPFQNKRRFVFDSSETVKHENEQNIKLFIQRRFFQFLNGVPLFGGYLEAGDPLLLLFNQDSPSHSGGEIVAGNPLHRNVVFDHIDLLRGGNPIQAIHSFHFLCLLSPALSGTGISVPISIMPFVRFDKCAG